jgi:DNA-binding MarR family transcriptional regulator
VKQRDIADIVGVSLGMTNAILKRLSQKGLVTIKRVNNRNLRYAVSPEGMDAIARRSYRYFKRTIKNVVYYRDAIETLVHQASRDGFENLVLVGQSDLAFILEHFCEKYGVGFRAVADDDPPAGANTAGRPLVDGADGSPGAEDAFTVYGEECDIPDGQTEETNSIHLQHLLEG